MSACVPAQANRVDRIARLTWTAVAAIVLSAASGTPVLAQYDSGSSGVHGAFPPAPVPAAARFVLWNLRTGLLRYCVTYDEVLRPETCPDQISTAQIQNIPQGGLTTGIYEFTNFDVTSPFTGFLIVYPVGHDGPPPLTILSQQSIRMVRITFRLDGQNGQSIPAGIPLPGFSAYGGRPGPGGFAGGAGGKFGSPSTGGSPGLGPTGGAASSPSAPSGIAATPTPVATSLVPLIGGSGGSGSSGLDTSCGFRGAGGGGGGGGGALLLAANVQVALESSTIDVTAGQGGVGCNFVGGAGSSGSLRIASPTITGNGSSLQLGNGIVRLEGNATTFVASISVQNLRGSVLATPQPAIPTGVPTLRITSVGGLAVGQNPSGSVATPDVTFQTAPSGPVTIDLAAANIPVPNVVSVRASPLVGAQTATTSTLTGTQQSSTASASLAIPAGAGVITAVTSFPVTIAMLDRLPPLPGFKPSLIEVTADALGASRLFVIGDDSTRVELTMGTDGRFAVVPAE
jgi:hypothetical protein